jgi:hypothetical protein
MKPRSRPTQLLSPEGIVLRQDDLFLEVEGCEPSEDDPSAPAGHDSDKAQELSVTPDWLIDLAARETIGRPHGRILDPGAGTGAIASRLEWLATREPYGKEEHRPQITAAELVAERTAAYPKHWTVATGDFFEWALEYRKGIEARDPAFPRFDLVATNPAFRIWNEWLQACWPLLAMGGNLLAIGPMAYLGGADRGAWWRSLGEGGAKKLSKPLLVLPMPRRPKGGGWTNTRDIMVVHWRRTGHQILTTEIRWVEI